MSKVQVDQIVDKTDTGAPNCPRGLTVTGVLTATSFSGSVSVSSFSSTSGISTNVIGGIGSLSRLQVSGISTFTSGPVLIGAATSTGTASQILQVTGGAYVSSSVGIGTTIANTTLQVQGSSTASDTRFQSVCEETTLINGNTASLVYNTGGGNIAICTNATGDITLAVTGIPTDSTFNNNSLTFSVCSLNAGTARSCTAVTLNGVSATIRWAGGSFSNAISGVTTSVGMDIYSFTGINTIGSANTTTNYYVLGVVNGGYR